MNVSVFFDYENINQKGAKMSRQSNARKKAVVSVQEVKLPTRKPMQLDMIKPLTFTQARVFKEYEKGAHMALHGVAGTGKTFLALYLALQSIERDEYEKIVIIRSAEPVHSQGFLPGDLNEKSAVFEAPYAQICADLYNRTEAYKTLKDRKQIEFITTSYARGITIDDAIIIIDEVQSLTAHELDTCMTRVGEDCRVILCGDYRQSDLKKDSEKRDFAKSLDRLKRMDGISFIEFQVNDIVRGAFCKAWIESGLED